MNQLTVMRCPSTGIPVHVPVRYKTKVTQYKFNQRDMIGEVKKTFCHAEKLKLSSGSLIQMHSGCNLFS